MPLTANIQIGGTEHLHSLGLEDAEISSTFGLSDAMMHHRLADDSLMELGTNTGQL